MNKTVIMTTSFEHEIAFRYQMSAMAWVMCGLCAWIILLSALATNANGHNVNYKTSHQQVEAPSRQ